MHPADSPPSARETWIPTLFKAKKGFILPENCRHFNTKKRNIFMIVAFVDMLLHASSTSLPARSSCSHAGARSEWLSCNHPRFARADCRCLIPPCLAEWTNATFRLLSFTRQAAPSPSTLSARRTGMEDVRFDCRFRPTLRQSPKAPTVSRMASTVSRMASTIGAKVPHGSGLFDSA